MKKSIFNTVFQQQSITSKIVVGLERISEVFKSLLWDYAKTKGISPIQIQILIFIAYHKSEFCKVSYLANEFNVTKPTISDAVKVLHQKKLVEKFHTETDNRSYTIGLTINGEKMVAETEKFTLPIEEEVNKIDNSELEILYKSINGLIYNLHKSGILTIQRTCFACKFYNKKDNNHFCDFLNKELIIKELRVDCPEFESINKTVS